MIKEKINNVITLLEAMKDHPLLNGDKHKIEVIIRELRNIVSKIGDITSNNLRTTLEDLEKSVIQLSQELACEFPSDISDKLNKVFRNIRFFMIALMIKEEEKLLPIGQGGRADNLSTEISQLIREMLERNTQDGALLTDSLNKSIRLTKEKTEELQGLVQNVKNIANIISIFDSILGIFLVL